MCLPSEVHRIRQIEISALTLDDAFSQLVSKCRNVIHSLLYFFLKFKKKKKKKKKNLFRFKHSCSRRHKNDILVFR
jgi:hypothetical protein